MPNHVKHEMIIIGEENKIKELLKSVRTKGKDEINHLDFDKFAPMPKALRNTKSPMSIISEKEYKEQEERIKTGNLTEFEKNFGISRCLTKKVSNQYKKKYGADNWYDWANENWGTKWGAYDTNAVDNVITFYTAWSTPYKALTKLSATYPDLTFKVRFADEDFGANVGEYTLIGGTEINVNIPKNGSLEAIEMAMDIRNDEYYITDYLCDEPEHNEFVDSLIVVAHKKGYLVDQYPKYVLNRLKEMALDAEQYERCAEIDKILTTK